MTQDRYIVFDVETPNRYNNRMSAIGIAVVEENRITDEFFSYVNPETFFDFYNTKLTGINERTVSSAPSFPQLWRQIEPVFSSGILVAHNAVFDLGVLKKCLKSIGCPALSFDIEANVVRVDESMCNGCGLCRCKRICEKVCDVSSTVKYKCSFQVTVQNRF